jgi:hypothetical protein
LTQSGGKQGRNPALQKQLLFSLLVPTWQGNRVPIAGRARYDGHLDLREALRLIREARAT